MTERLLYPDWPYGGIDRPTVGFEKSATRQADAEGADINAIMKRYEKTGVLPVGAREAVFADVSSFGTYRDALDNLQVAQEAFMTLPAKVRERFLNDPVAFVDFCSDEGNRGELEALGLVEKAAEAVPAPEAPK